MADTEIEQLQLAQSLMTDALAVLDRVHPVAAAKLGDVLAILDDSQDAGNATGNAALN